jgi:hypothetical protein
VNLPLHRLDRALCDVERSVALLSRCRPQNLRAEMASVREAWKRGCPTAPTFRYGRLPDLTWARRWLDQVIEELDSQHGWGRLYAERVRELAREATVAERIGTRGFAEIAGLRYPWVTGPDGARADRWAAEWSSPAADTRGLTRHLSDDDRDPGSLVARMRRAVGERRLPWRVVVDWRLQSAAASTDSHILIRPGVLHTPQVAERIVHHEVLGHVLPRARARCDPVGLCRTATAEGCDDEEGRALLIERRAGLLDDERRATLAWRHRAARAVREGADWQQVVRLLCETGASLECSLDIAARVFRGGGLARELVYLPALSRLSRNLARDGTLESWLERGRIGIGAAAELCRLGPPPAQLDCCRAT